jgi:pimeloyl-ACP methyl ester carboxylesterase
MLSALPLVEQPLPAWVCASFWASYVAGRAAVNNVLGLPSRFVAVEGFGTFHVLDSHPQSSFSLDASTPPTDGPPLFIIHGMFTNGLSMALLAAALADGGRRRVIVPDLLGSDFGCSTLTPIGGGSNDNDNDPSSSDAKKQHLTIARHVASLAALLNALGLSTVDVLGHSFGGFLAQELDLLLPPWRVRRLVLLCPGGGNRYLAGQSLRTIMGADVRATMEIFEHSIHNESLRRAVAAVFRTLSRTPYQTTLLLDVFDAQKYFLKFHDLSSKPVLLLWGSKDSVLEPREAKVQWRHMRGHPSSRAFWVEGSSHALNVDALATVSSATASFLDASSRSSDAAAAAAATAGSVMAQRPEPLGWFAAAVCAVPSMHRPLRPMMAEGLGHRSREEVEKANPRLLASRL